MGRPLPRFHDFVGQRNIVAQLQRQMQGALARGEPFPHSLIFGPSGTGKTLLSQALASEYGAQLIIAISCDDVPELAQKCLTLQEGDLLFIDEAHNLKPAAQELLYQVIDKGQLIIPSEEKSRPGRTSELQRPIAPCTIILATDQPGRLRDALRKRMDLIVKLDLYSVEELKEIAESVAKRLDILISPQAAREIAKISVGVPRRVKHHLANLRRHFSDAEKRQLTVEDVREYRGAWEIDELGLGKLERRYLNFLASSNVASIASVAMELGCDEQYVLREVESVVIRCRLAQVTSAGRRLTAKGESWARENKVRSEHVDT